MRKTFLFGSTKKIISFCIGVLIAICLIPTSYQVQAADNDNFDVTMSGAYLECNIINASWAIGTVQMSTSYWTNETGETEEADTHNCTAGTNIDYEMVISSNPADWVTIWTGNASTGANSYRINASSDSWVSPANGTQLNLTTYVGVEANFDPANNCSFDLRFDSPTSTTTGVQQTITLNGKVTVH